MGKLSQLERALQNLRVRREALDQVIRELEGVTALAVAHRDLTSRQPVTRRVRVRKPKPEPVTP